MTAEVQGTAAAGFGAVSDMFGAHLEEIGQGGAAFAATVDGELVVDLWAGKSGSEPWHRETRAVLMSTTKGIASVAFARLIQRGLVDIDAPVARYWPEFAASGKAQVTVAQVLAHTCGVITVPGYQEFLTPEGHGWDKTGEILRRLESAEPVWEPGTAVGYHGLTWGWLVDEIAHRAAGMSLGTVVRVEIAEPLGLELDLGTPAERQQLVATPIPEPPAPLPPGADPQLTAQMILATDGRHLVDVADVFFTGDRLAMELPASNGTATARAVATLYGALAEGGERGGHRILEPATIELLAGERASGLDQITGSQTRWGLGVNRNRPRAVGEGLMWGPNDAAFGTNGAGGQIGFADPTDRVGVGFVRSHLSATSPLGGRLVDSLYECLGKA